MKNTENRASSARIKTADQPAIGGHFKNLDATFSESNFKLIL